MLHFVLQYLYGVLFSRTALLALSQIARAVITYCYDYYGSKLDIQLADSTVGSINPIFGYLPRHLDDWYSADCLWRYTLLLPKHFIDAQITQKRLRYLRRKPQAECFSFAIYCLLSTPRPDYYSSVTIMLILAPHYQQNLWEWPTCHVSSTLPNLLLFDKSLHI